MRKKDSIIYNRQEVIKMAEKQYIFTFNSTHHALMFEKAANENNSNIIIMPVPRSIASSCGLAVKFSQENYEEIVEMVKNKGLSYADLYRIEDSGGEKKYIKQNI